MAAGGVKLRLVFDENFSHQQVEFVHRESQLGDLTHTRKTGWSGMRDREWIPLAIRANFVIVTGDRNDRTREYTVEDLKGLGAQIIFVGPFWDHLNRWEKAKWLCASIDRIVFIAQEIPPGSARLLVDRFCHVRAL